jgi:hypothetical protein
MDSHSASIIVRSAGERTIELCEKLILEQGIEKQNIFFVREVPFSAAMKKSFNLGISAGLPWTFCVDADVLLRPGSIDHMVEIASGLDDKVCEIQGMMLDKFFAGPRPGGIHLYRTLLLPEVLKRVPGEGTDIRPEFHTLKRMQAEGFPYAKVPYIVGIHDFEQYNFDIYRKCYVHGLKHIKHAEMLVSIWKDLSVTDDDFKVALKAFSDSIRHTEPAFINSKQDIYNRLFRESGFREKDELDPDAYSLTSIENIINNWIEPEAYMKKFPTRWGLDNPGVFERIQRMINARGGFRTLAFMTGKAFSDIGGSLIRFSNPK